MSLKNPPRRQTFIVTTGFDNPNKVSVALAQASHSQALGNDVLVFFVSDGFRWTLSGSQDANDLCFGSIKESITNLSNLGARMLVCRTCYDKLDREGCDGLEDGVEMGTFSMVQDFIAENAVVFSY